MSTPKMSNGNGFVTQPESALADLQSDAQNELLDVIDRLRLCNMQHELDLPQLIVCGNQSAGKSSVLEAISHVRFPAADRCTTRFASELILRRSPVSKARVTIQPCDTALPDIQEHLRSFEGKLKNLNEFSSLLEAATEHMRSKDESGWTYSPHRLRMEISGPQQPHLTLVDMPGLIWNTTPSQTAGDIEVVKGIVESYMRQPTSIILAVMSAPEDVQNQHAFELAKAYDPHGVRTMGILTKPDLVESGSEHRVLELARNESDHKLSLGWHVLKNRGNKLHGVSSDTRDTAENDFFESPEGQWWVLPKSLCGITSLREKLSEVLLKKIARSLPKLTRDIRHMIASDERKVERLGAPRPTKYQQCLFLDEIVMKFFNLVTQASDGHYRDHFFGDAEKGQNKSKRLRTKLWRLEENFVIKITRNGRQFHVRNKDICFIHNGAEPCTDFAISESGPPVCVTRAEAEIAVSNYIADNHGRQLPGEVQTGAIAQVFRVQCSPWDQIAREYADMAIQTTHEFLQLALRHVAPLHTADAIFNHIACPKLDICRKALQAKVSELIMPFRKLSAATKNPKFCCNPLIRDAFNGKLQEARQVLHAVDAYYEVSQYTFIDNIIALGVENCIVEQLQTFFNSKVVREMSEGMLAMVACEPQHILQDREATKQKLETLHDVLQVVKKYASSVYDEQQIAEIEYETLPHRPNINSKSTPPPAAAATRLTPYTPSSTLQRLQDGQWTADFVKHNDGFTFSSPNQTTFASPIQVSYRD